MDKGDGAEVQHRNNKNAGVAVQPAPDAYQDRSYNYGAKNVSHAYAGNATNNTEQTRVRVGLSMSDFR